MHPCSAGRHRSASSSHSAAACARAWQHREAAADRPSPIWECEDLRCNRRTLPSQTAAGLEQNGGADASPMRNRTKAKDAPPVPDVAKAMAAVYFSYESEPAPAAEDPMAAAG